MIEAGNKVVSIEKWSEWKTNGIQWSEIDAGKIKIILKDVDGAKGSCDWSVKLLLATTNGRLQNEIKEHKS